MSKRVRGVICGDSTVGKSSIFNSFLSHSFSEEILSTVAGFYHILHLRGKGGPIVLEVWDTAGSERYLSVIPSFFRNVSVVGIVYDTTNRSSFDNLPFWVKFVKQNSMNGVQIILIGNKSDDTAHRTVQTEEGRKFAIDYHFSQFIESSAKTGDSIDLIFNQMALVGAATSGGLSPEGTSSEPIRKSCC